jgi:hypothetical protein
MGPVYELQVFVREHPKLISMVDFEPAIAPLVPICRKPEITSLDAAKPI